MLGAWFTPVSSPVGYGGACMIALAYFLNQRGALSSQDWRFPAVNLGGSLLVLLSLSYTVNPPSVVIELFWSAISVYGVARNLRLRGRAKA